MNFDKRSDSGPIFRQLARKLIESIESGEIAVGSLLPTEAELGQRHGVGRQTVRDAMAELRSRGLIVSRQGIGSVVLSNRVEETYVETFCSVDELIQFGRTTPLHPMSSGEIVANAALSARLHGREGQSYLRIVGARPDPSAPSGPPAGFVEVHVDAMYSGIRDDLPGLKTSLAEAITSRYGLEIARIEQTIESVALPADVATALSVEPGSPALLISRWYFEQSGRAFEIAFTHYPTGRFIYRSSLVRRPAAQTR